MNAPFKQAGRLGRLATCLGGDALVLLRFTGEDYVNELFEYRVEALSPDPRVDFDALLGSHATVTIETRGGPRHFDGIVARTRRVGSGENGHIYELILRPWFWLAGRRNNQKIFHQKSVDQILTELLAPYAGAGNPAMELRLSKSYPTLEYTVQYRESDLDFARRMMERFGISYHFVHAPTNHTLVLTDSDSGHEPVAGGARPYHPADKHHQADEEHFWSIAPERNLTTGAVRLIDYNFKTPMAAMEAERVGDAAHAFGKLESYEYPGDYLDQAEGQMLARLRTEQFRGKDRRNRAEGDCVSLGAGMIVTLTGDELPGVEPRQICLAASHSFMSEAYGSGPDTSDGYAYTGSYTLMPASAPIVPPRQTPRPVVQGPQTAVVVGDGEIDCDEFGRVLVRFHWDLEGAISMRCRVSQQWAGNGLGAVVIPRIGMEVIVDFIDGNPDKPLVTGCVVNAANANIYGLPDNKTKSGFKTKTHNGGGFNEMSLDDATGAERIFMHAQKDMDSIVQDNQTLQVVGGNRSIAVDTGDETKTIGSGNLTETIALDRTSTASSITENAVGGGGPANIVNYAVNDIIQKADQNILREAGASAKTAALANIEESAKVDILMAAEQNISSTAKNEFRAEGVNKVDVQSKKVHVSATEEIVLMVGASKITLKTDGIVLEHGGTTISMNASELVQIAGMIKLNK